MMKKILLNVEIKHIIQKQKNIILNLKILYLRILNLKNQLFIVREKKLVEIIFKQVCILKNISRKEILE